MQLTHFTDYGLRVLMYLAHAEGGQPVTISEIASSFNISRNHLVKVVHFMAQQKWIATTQGKGGGLALAQPATHYQLGQVIRQLEGTTELINCSSPACILQLGCELKTILNKAFEVFFDELDHYTLADLVKNQTSITIIGLHSLIGRSARTITSIEELG